MHLAYPSGMPLFGSMRETVGGRFRVVWRWRTKQYSCDRTRTTWYNVAYCFYAATKLSPTAQICRPTLFFSQPVTHVESCSSHALREGIVMFERCSANRPNRAGKFSRPRFWTLKIPYKLTCRFERLWCLHYGANTDINAATRCVLRACNDAMKQNATAAMRFRLGTPWPQSPGPRWGSLQCSPKPLCWF